MSQNPWQMWKDAAITFEPVPKQLSVMWRKFGRRESQKCGTCRHLIVHGGNTSYYFKCEYYGITSGAATDWRKKWIACGQWEKKDDGINRSGITEGDTAG